MTGAEVIKLLKKQGWKLDRIKGSHHILKKGSLTLSVPVHGKKDLPIGLLNRILKDGGVK